MLPVFASISSRSYGGSSRPTTWSVASLGGISRHTSNTSRNPLRSPHVVAAYTNSGRRSHTIGRAQTTGSTE